MYEAHLWMVFIIGVLASIGTYGGIATQYAAIINLISWSLIGMGAASTTVLTGDGSTMIVGEQAVGLVYFAYFNAIAGLLPWFVTIYEWYTQEEAAINQNSPGLEGLTNGD